MDSEKDSDVTNGPSRNGNRARMYPGRSHFPFTNIRNNPGTATTTNNQSSTLRKRKSSIGIPTENYFTHTFEVLSSVKQEQLEHRYVSNQGRLPSRIGLRAMSQELGLSQNRIRKWFYDRSKKKLEEARNGHAHNLPLIELEQLLEEIKDNWENISDMQRSH